jgi:hypothetical protein
MANQKQEVKKNNYIPFRTITSFEKNILLAK